MFTATYPASFLPEKGGGFHVRFPDLPEALTGGEDLSDTLEQAEDCLAEAIGGRIARGEYVALTDLFDDMERRRRKAGAKRPRKVSR